MVGLAKEQMTCAYLTLVMKGDEYVSGALVLAKSLRLTGTKHVIACMITSDVSMIAQDDLHKVFDAVHVVDYYNAQVTRLRTDKAEKMYEAWMSISLTWYQALKLEQYEKVLLLDSDVAILRNMDNLFNLSTPAGCFHSFWQRPYYGQLKHGSKVPSKHIMQALHDRKGMFVCIGNGLLLSPLQEAFTAFDECMLDFAEKHNGSLGFPESISGINEQMIAYFYVEHGFTWTHIGTQYQIIPWKKVKNSKEAPYLFHYFNMKPWRMNISAWPDLQVWWRFAKAVLNDNPESIRYIPEDFQQNLIAIESFMPSCCFWCSDHGHPFMSRDCKIQCQKFLDNED